MYILRLTLKGEGSRSEGVLDRLGTAKRRHFSNRLAGSCTRSRTFREREVEYVVLGKVPVDGTVWEAARACKEQVVAA